MPIAWTIWVRHTHLSWLSLCSQQTLGLLWNFVLNSISKQISILHASSGKELCKLSNVSNHCFVMLIYSTVLLQLYCSLSCCPSGQPVFGKQPVFGFLLTFVNVQTEIKGLNIKTAKFVPFCGTFLRIFLSWLSAFGVLFMVSISVVCWMKYLPVYSHCLYSLSQFGPWIICSPFRHVMLFNLFIFGALIMRHGTQSPKVFDLCCLHKHCFSCNNSH